MPSCSCLVLPARYTRGVDVEAAVRELSSDAWTARVDAVNRVAAWLQQALEPAQRERLLAALVDAARDTKWEVRKAAADALGTRGATGAPDRAADEVLRKLEQDPNRWVRQAAQRSGRRRLGDGPASRARQRDDETERFVLERIRGLGRRRLSPAQLLELAHEVGDRHYRELGADMAHELRTLVWPLRLQLDHALEQVGRARRRDPVVTRAMSALQKGLGRLEQLVTDLFEYTDDRDEPRAIVDLAAIAELGADMGRERAALGGQVAVDRVELRLRPAEGLRVRGVSFRLARAVANLVANAYQAVPPAGGTVTVRTEVGARQDEVQVAVQDTGKGMSADQLEQAVRRFKSTRKDEGGTGLGLPIARRIIEVDHGGRLMIESAPGQGTTVRLVLPAAEEA